MNSIYNKKKAYIFKKETLKHPQEHFKYLHKITDNCILLVLDHRHFK